ncbi:MAG: tetratricopeptide repeat protein, partial [Candidatus Fermentibacteraceae bacterium]|nr:tetratricopeptide repeat protein [Candidatus Fermentibacteraceae bacterium]
MITGKNILLKVNGSALNILLIVVVCTVFISCGSESETSEDPSVIFAEAGEAYGRGDLATCRELLLRVTVLDPENPNVWRNLGTVNLDIGLYDDAISAYWMVIEIDSTRVDVLTDVTGALVGAGRIEEALHTGEMSVRFSPEDGLAFNNYGMALLENGNYEEAAVCFSTALHREPENSSVLYNCGRIT